MFGKRLAANQVVSIEIKAVTSFSYVQLMRGLCRPPCEYDLFKEFAVDNFYWLLFM